MNEIIKKPWNYVLYEDNQEYILSVLCGSVATYDLNIHLSPDEKTRYLQHGESFIDELAAKIQYSPSAYQPRHIKM